MRHLILNADDFGLTLGVNTGIIQAHREGILTSTTIMANAPAFDDAVRRARENPALGVGVHLVLVGGRPVAPPREIASLVDRNGQLPESLPNFMARVTSRAIRQEDMERELHAQIGKVRATGISPTHVDSHKHTHAHPRVMESVARVAHACGIMRVRKPFETAHDSWNSTRGLRAASMSQLIAATAARIASRSFAAISRKYGLRSPDTFLGLASTGNINISVLRGLIDTLPDGTSEIMLHPGLCDPDLVRTRSRLQMHRERELAALVAPQIKEILVERVVRLITYREVN